MSEQLRTKDSPPFAAAGGAEIGAGRVVSHPHCTTDGAQAQAILARLHRGGAYGYLWTLPGNVSHWYQVGDPLPKAKGDAVYFGVNPTAELPTGYMQSCRAVVERKPGNEQSPLVAVTNCLFAEFDDKDHGGDHASLWADVIDVLEPPPSIVIDSGGGYHCYWLLSKPFLLTTDAARARAIRLQAAWVGYVGGDDGAKDLVRPLRLPGTMNRKYDPPRPVKILTCDLELAYDLASLEALLPPTTTDAPRLTVHGEAVPTERGPVDLLDELPKTVTALRRLDPDRADGYGDWVQVGMALSELGDAGLQLWEAWSQQSAKYEPGVCARKWGTFEPGHGLTLASLYHWAKGDGGNGDGGGAMGALTLGEIAGAVGDLSWAWPGWTPNGYLSMFAAEQGMGKSYLAAHAIAVLTGAIPAWPDGADCPRRGPVVLVETEGFRGEYARRLFALGVAPDRVLFPTDADRDAFFVADLLRDMAGIAALAQEHRAAAVVVDSLSGGHGLDENSADMRRVLKALAQLSGGLGVPVVVVHHLTKRNPFAKNSSRASVDRIRGSSTISQFCRVILGLWREDEAQDAPTRAEVIKSNLGKPPPPFGFTIGGAGLTFCEAPQEQKPETAGDRAAEFLRVHLQREPMRYGALLAQAEAEGISKNALYAARNRLGIVTADGAWSLPYRPGTQE